MEIVEHLLVLVHLLGMAAIKVTSGDQALDDLGALLGMAFE